MIESFKIQAATIIAAMTPPRSRSAFHRGALILECEGRFLRVRTYLEAGLAQGDLLTKDDFQALLASGHAVSLPSSPSATMGGGLWVIRKNFVSADEAIQQLQSSGVLVAPIQRSAEEDRFCVVKEGEEADRLRRMWSNRAQEQCEQQARYGDWKRAEAHAERAMAVAPVLDAERIALLVVCYERNQSARAEGMRKMAERSKGAEFREIFERARSKFQAQYSEVSRHPGLMDALEKLKGPIAEGLGHSGSSRLLQAA